MLYISNANGIFFSCCTVHWRVQICHKSLSVVYDIKKCFLLRYLMTAWHPESELCYLYINALCNNIIFDHSVIHHCNLITSPDA